MKSKSNYSELVQKYLADEMSKEEIVLFKSKLEQDQSLRKELDFHQRLDDVLMDDELSHFKVVLDKIHQELKPGRSKKYDLYSRKWSLVAASLLILIVVSLVFFCESDVWSKDGEIFDKYYSRYNPQNVVRSHTGCSGHEEYLSALELYNNEKYSEAKHAFQRIIGEKPKNIGAKFYLGVTHIELGDTENAIKYFDEVINSGDLFYIEHSQWYKSLCFIKMDNETEAMKQLVMISGKGGFYQNRADEIISKIK